jgi:hypothetical protein
MKRMGLVRKITYMALPIGLIALVTIFFSKNRREEIAAVPVPVSLPVSAPDTAPVSTTVSASSPTAPPAIAQFPAIHTIDELKSFAKLDSNRFDFLEKKWKVAKNLIAVPLKPNEKPGKNALIHIQKLDLYESENSFSDPRGKPVLIFPERNRLGFISGTLLIRLTDSNFEKSVIQNHTLKIEQFFPAISTLVARTDSMQELLQTRSRLLNDDRIQSIEVEVVEDKLERQ